MSVCVNIGMSQNMCMQIKACVHTQSMPILEPRNLLNEIMSSIFPPRQNTTSELNLIFLEIL